MKNFKEILERVVSKPTSGTKPKKKTDFVMKVAKSRRPDAWFIKFQ